MTKQEMVNALDNAGAFIFDIDIKGKDALKVANALRAINIVRNEIDKDRKDDEDVSCGQKV